MVTAWEVTFVFTAGLVTALATGVGAVPFFVVEDIGDRWNVVLWGVASGIMLAASGFGLVVEALAMSDRFPTLLLAGAAVGVMLVVVADAILDRVNFGTEAEDGLSRGEPDRTDGGNDTPLVSEAVAVGDLRKLVLILGVLTVHSFPEGVAVGVSFADLGLDNGVALFGLTVPVLAVFMTIAISIHNVPEGVAVSIPLRAMGVSEWRMVAAAVFSSLPQPIGAVIAFVFVSWARAFLPFGFGFAAGAMMYLVAAEFIPEALETGSELPGGGRKELVAGLMAGIVAMLPLLFV